MTLSFGLISDQVELRTCSACGLDVPHVAVRYRVRGSDLEGTLWQAEGHQARCERLCSLSPRPAVVLNVEQDVHFRDCAACTRRAS